MSGCSWLPHPSRTSKLKYYYYYYLKSTIYNAGRDGSPLDYPLRVLRKMQRRAALWISGAFRTSPTAGVEAISGLMPIHLQLKKLYERFHLRGFSLPSNHIFKLIIDTEKSSDHQCISLNNLMAKQKSRLHSPLIDMDERCNEFLPTFSPFNDEFSPGSRLIDSFSDHFSFHD